ncbi:MAG: hypothetical protein M1830_007621 [Pleopsidium flavum]|nr:MAG: hypothetical protein M1830_007621 [Pleopsidium flavum]
MRERLHVAPFVTTDAPTHRRDAALEPRLVISARDVNVREPVQISPRNAPQTATAQSPSSDAAEESKSQAKSDPDGRTQTTVDHGGPLLYDRLGRGPISGFSTPYTMPTSIAPPTTSAPRQRSTSSLPDYTQVFARFGLRSPENHYGYGRSPNDPETGYSSLEGPYNHGYRPGGGIIDPRYCPPGQTPRAYAIHGDFIGDGRMGSGRFVDRTGGPQRWRGSVSEARMWREVGTRGGRQGRDEGFEEALERVRLRARLGSAVGEFREPRLQWELPRGVGNGGLALGRGLDGGTAGGRSSEQLGEDDGTRSIWGDDTTLVDPDEERGRP